MTKAVFLDRDGVINIDKAYVSKIEDFEFCEGVFEALNHFQNLWYLLIVVTNQSRIGRGYYSEDDFYTIVERILRGEINALKDTGVLDKLAIMKPYSFVLVDEDRETVTELLLIDDEDTLLLNDELLKGLDEELDAFLKDLLEK